MRTVFFLMQLVDGFKTPLLDVGRELERGHICLAASGDTTGSSMQRPCPSMGRR
jgi:hypothetical protein